MTYGLVIVGGTFDGLHVGHQAILARAFELGKKVIIGLTTDLFVKHYRKNIKYQISNIKYTNKISKRIKTGPIASYSQRKSSLEQWLRKKGWERRATIIPIDDPWEPAASDPEAEALIVTAQNKFHGDEINAIRKKRGLTPLVLIEVPLVAAEDGRPISASRVRNNEIDGNGKLIMPESLRHTLAQPLGKVLVGEAISRSLEEHKDKIIVTVGDVATKTLLDVGVTPYLMIIDNKVGRQPYTGLDPWRKNVLQNSIKVVSGPGYISREAIEAIRQWAALPLKESPLKVIEVEGEEDLLTLPVVVEAPLGAFVYYGQPEQGLVEVEVSETKKIEAKHLLQQFTS